MSCWQRRIGPLNLGIFGILSALINGLNLIIAHVVIPNLHYSLLFNIVPIYYLFIGFIVYYISYPFFIYDLYLSFICLILISGLSIIFIVFASFSGCSKYSILGAVRIISQFISFEFIFSSLYYYYIFSYYSLYISTLYHLFFYIILLFLVIMCLFILFAIFRNSILYSFIGLFLKHPFASAHIN